MNPGKIFEQQWKLSSENQKICCIRLKDSDMSFHPEKELRSKFTAKNPCDFIQFFQGHLFAMELKSTQYNSISIQIDEEDSQKMIKKHQINSLINLANYEGVVAGFVLNFREKDSLAEDTYFIDIQHFSDFLDKTGKKSINRLDIVQFGGINIHQTLKRTKYIYDVKKALEKIIQDKYFFDGI